MQRHLSYYRTLQKDPRTFVVDERSMIASESFAASAASVASVAYGRLLALLAPAGFVPKKHRHLTLSHLFSLPPPYLLIFRVWFPVDVDVDVG